MIHCNLIRTWPMCTIPYFARFLLYCLFNAVIRVINLIIILGPLQFIIFSIKNICTLFTLTTTSSCTFVLQQCNGMPLKEEFVKENVLELAAKFEEETWEMYLMMNDLEKSLAGGHYFRMFLSSTYHCRPSQSLNWAWLGFQVLTTTIYPNIMFPVKSILCRRIVTGVKRQSEGSSRGAGRC